MTRCLAIVSEPLLTPRMCSCGPGPARPTRGPTRGHTQGAHPRGPPAHPRGPSGWTYAGPKWGPSGWAHAGPKWVGPRGAQVGGPTRGPSGPKWAQARNLGPKKIQKIKILKIQIRSAQNVGKVWISRNKSSWAHLGPFFAWAGKIQKMLKFCQFSLVGQWALFTRFRPMGQM